METSEIVTLVYKELLKVAGGAAVVIGALSAFLGKVWISRIANAESQKREAAITELKAQLVSCAVSRVN